MAGLSITFDKVAHFFVQDRTVIDAVAGVSLVVPAGQFVSIVGPSGCGKTTLLNMVAGVISPAVGTVKLGDRTVKGPSPSVGYMLARDALLPWRTVISNVTLGLEIRHVPIKEALERAAEWLDRVGLNDFTHSRVWQLSQGMRQRVALARTLALSPHCILMDEPFAAVDAQTRLTLQQEFSELWARENSTVLFVTHDIGESILLSDRVLLMSPRPGQIVMDVEIKLSRPRDLDRVRSDSRFIHYAEQISDGLREATGAKTSRDTRPGRTLTGLGRACDRGVHE
jgi:NitT/TauT family transport system ATP-binding protein